VNRAIVRSGLAVMNQCERSAWRALKALLQRDGDFQVDDLGFQMGPRINARGRIADPAIALTFLLATEDHLALDLLKSLDANNEERKQIERQMLEIARTHAHAAVAASAVSVVSTHDDFHPGVQGIVASRIVDSVGRVCVVLSPTLDPTILSGSVRSIEGVHVREVLARVNILHPHILKSFGGHAGAAGLKLLREHLDLFKQAFEAAVLEQLKVQEIHPIVWTDGPLPNQRLDLSLMRELSQLVPFGRGFSAPLFEDIFEVMNINAMGKIPVHLNLQLRKNQYQYRAVWFNALAHPEEILPFERGDHVHCAFKLSENIYQGCARLQLLVECASFVNIVVGVEE
jgi:single-stranded-DNA-specific exonuclease